MKALNLLVCVVLLGGAHAYTLAVTTCDCEWCDTADLDTVFQFCEGGSYCDTGDFEVELPTSAPLSYGETAFISVNPGYEPTKAKIVKDNTDAWCISNITWEGGDNLLGEDSRIWLDAGEGEGDCLDGLGDFGDSPVSVCKDEWIIFNLEGSSDYEYDVRVKACAGMSSSTALAYFCSNYTCDGTVGEEELVELKMSDVDGGWTDISFPLPFNPVAMRLEEADGNATWCADDLTFNAFPLNSPNDVISTGARIFWNIQEHDQVDTTPAPAGSTPAPESPTPAPVLQTLAPGSLTLAPGRPTLAPDIATLTPDSPTLAPDSPLPAPLKGVSPTPSPVDRSAVSEEEADEGEGDGESGNDAWLNAAWEVAVTVVASAVVAAGAACMALLFRRNIPRRPSQGPPPPYAGPAEECAAEVNRR